MIKPGHSRRERGFSIIEVLIASVLLLIMVLGILPLFYRSTVNNAMGADSSQLSNLSKSRVEEYSQLAFNSPQLTPVGGATVLRTIDYWSPTVENFVPTAPGGGAPIRFQRTTEIRQYAMADLLDDGDLDTALPGSADPSTVQIKEILVIVESYIRGTAVGSGPIPGRRILVRSLKTI